jgi:hypothetical protein
VDDIKDLAHIVAQNGPHKPDILRNGISGANKRNIFNRAFDGIINGKILTDEALSHYIYGENPTVTFRAFKHRLKNKLINSFYFLDLNRKNISEYTRAGFICSRYQHCIRMLLLFSARKTAMKLTSTVLFTALKFELTEYIIFCARILRVNAAYTGDRRNFAKYLLLYQQWEKTDHHEEMAKTFLDRIFLHYSGSVALKPELSDMAFSYAMEIEKMLAETPTYVLRLYYYRIKGLATHISQDYAGSIKIWDEMESFLSSNKLMEKKSRYAEVSLQKMASYLHLRNYDEGRKCAEKCSKYFRTGSNNWVTFMEYNFLLAMQSGTYSDAGSIISEVFRSKPLNAMPEASREKWKIFEAYYMFILRTDQNEEPQKELKTNFKINRFVNEVIMYSSDKRGFNIAIIIVQILFLLYDRKIPLLIEKIQSLRLYRSRYLRMDINFRVNVFIQMLIEMDKMEYNYLATKKKAVFLSKKLLSGSMIYRGNMEGMEIIPFEDLWEIILKILQTNSR